jgi:hypothetical protein
MAFWNALRQHSRIWMTAIYLVAALSWTMPKAYFPLKDELNAVISTPMVFFNIWQSWEMFAPNPRGDDIWTDVVYTRSDGQEGRWILTKMSDMPWIERWQKERWRKYFNDHLRTDGAKFLWKPFAEFTAARLKSESVDATTITLRRWWRPAGHPVSRSLKPGVRVDPWNHYDFYKWHKSPEESP